MLNQPSDSPTLPRFNLFSSVTAGTTEQVHDIWANWEHVHIMSSIYSSWNVVVQEADWSIQR